MGNLGTQEKRCLQNRFCRHMSPMIVYFYCDFHEALGSKWLTVISVDP